MKTSETSQESKASETSEGKQVKLFFENLHKMYRRIVQKDKKISDVQQLLEFLVIIGVLEERVVRNTRIHYNAEVGYAFADPVMIENFKMPYRAKLLEIATWLHQTIKESPFAEKFRFEWSTGAIYLKIMTKHVSPISVDVHGAVGEVETKETISTFQPLCEKLKQLGFIYRVFDAFMHKERQKRGSVLEAFCEAYTKNSAVAYLMITIDARLKKTEKTEEERVAEYLDHNAGQSLI